MISSVKELKGRAVFPKVRKIEPDGWPSNVKFPPIVKVQPEPVKVSPPKFSVLWEHLKAKHAKEVEDERLEKIRHQFAQLDMTKNLSDQSVANAYNRKLEQLRFISGSDERKREELQNFLSGLPFPQHVVNNAINRVNRERIQSQVDKFGAGGVHAAQVVHGEDRPRRPEDEMLGSMVGRARAPSFSSSVASTPGLPSTPMSFSFVPSTWKRAKTQSVAPSKRAKTPSVAPSKRAKTPSVAPSPIGRGVSARDLRLDDDEELTSILREFSGRKSGRSSRISGVEETKGVFGDGGGSGMGVLGLGTRAPSAVVTAVQAGMVGERAETRPGTALPKRTPLKDVAKETTDKARTGFTGAGKALGSDVRGELLKISPATRKQIKAEPVKINAGGSKKARQSVPANRLQYKKIGNKYFGFDPISGKQTYQLKEAKLREWGVPISKFKK